MPAFCMIPTVQLIIITIIFFYTQLYFDDQESLVALFVFSDGAAVADALLDNALV